MAFQKTLIILIVVLSIVLVLVAGVGAWFYFNQSTGVVESTPQTPIEEPTTQQIPSEPITGPTTPSATSNTEVEGGTETETNAEEEYNNLFSAVGATRLTLLPVNSGEIYNIYAADILP